MYCNKLDLPVKRASMINAITHFYNSLLNQRIQVNWLYFEIYCLLSQVLWIPLLLFCSFLKLTLSCEKRTIIPSWRKFSEMMTSSSEFSCSVLPLSQKTHCASTGRKKQSHIGRQSDVVMYASSLVKVAYLKLATRDQTKFSEGCLQW